MPALSWLMNLGFAGSKAVFNPLSRITTPGAPSRITVLESSTATVVSRTSTPADE